MLFFVFLTKNNMWVCDNVQKNEIKQKAVAKSLGINRIGDVTVQRNDASVLGKVKIIAHLVKVENV